MDGSLTSSMPWMGDSEAEVDWSCAERSAVLGVAFRTMLESRELKRNREAGLSVSVSGARWYEHQRLA